MAAHQTALQGALRDTWPAAANLMDLGLLRQFSDLVALTWSLCLGSEANLS